MIFCTWTLLFHREIEQEQPFLIEGLLSAQEKLEKNQNGVDHFLDQCGKVTFFCTRLEKSLFSTLVQKKRLLSFFCCAEKQPRDKENVLQKTETFNESKLSIPKSQRMRSSMRTAITMVVLCWQQRLKISPPSSTQYICCIYGKIRRCDYVSC